MCAHNASGHGIGCHQAICTPYVVDKYTSTCKANKFHHLTCKCVHTKRVGMVLGCQAIRTPYICSDKHTSACETNFFSLPKLSEGGSLHSPINHITLFKVTTGESTEPNITIQVLLNNVKALKPSKAGIMIDV